jgi:hypothetical protein
MVLRWGSINPPGWRYLAKTSASCRPCMNGINIGLRGLLAVHIVLLNLDSPDPRVPREVENRRELLSRNAGPVPVTSFAFSRKYLSA